MEHMTIQSIVFFGCLICILWLFYKGIMAEENRNKYYYITLPSNQDYELPDGSLLIRDHKNDYIITCIKGHAFEDESLKTKIENNSLASFKKVEYLDKPIKKGDIVILEHSDKKYSKCYFQAYIIQTVHKDGKYTITKKSKNPKRITKESILAKLAYKLCDLNPKYLETHSNF